MFGGSSSTQSVGGGLFDPKMRLKRIRTCSSDSGCEMVCSSPDLTYTIMEDAMLTWELRLDGVMKQEVARCREVTAWAKEALRHAGEGRVGVLSTLSLILAVDESKRGEVMDSWRSQLEGIMEFTKDLIECVNNDTKELMYDSSSGHDSASTIEELMEEEGVGEEEEDAQEDEIMQLFLLSAIEGNKNLNKRSKYGNKGLMKEFMSIYKRNGKMFRHSRKSNKEVQTAYAKVKRHESFNKKRLSWEETKFEEEFGHNVEDFHYSEKMFQSVMDWAEIFSDWTWNLREAQDGDQEYLAIFAEWRWNFEIKDDLKKKFYDDPEVEVEWNEFNFWKMSDNTQLDLDTGFLADCESEERDWGDCEYWQDSTANWNIIHGLLDEKEEEEEEEYQNYWDESAANQSIIESLLDGKDQLISEVDEEFIWDCKQPLIALMDFGCEAEKTETDEGIFLWNDKDIAMSLLNSDDEGFDDEERILWDNPLYIKTLLDAEEDDLIQFSDDEKNNWTSWAFWKTFGSTSQIVEAYENCVEHETLEIPTINIEEVFWDICLDESQAPSDKEPEAGANGDTPKDPLNIFKTFRHIFNVPKEKKKKVRRNVGDENHLFSDMEDIYADWICLTLSDQRTEKKRSKRGRKRSKKTELPGPALLPRQNNLQASRVSNKIPNKERKNTFARNQKRLQAKLLAKQPRRV